MSALDKIRIILSEREAEIEALTATIAAVGYGRARTDAVVRRDRLIREQSVMLRALSLCEQRVRRTEANHF